MITPIFSEKLDALSDTLELFCSYDASPIAEDLATGAGRHALSIGSGGSAIVAEYLARCRDTLGLGPTTVQTPMQAVLQQHDLTGSDVWLFSAGGDNPDAAAASRAVLDRGAANLYLVTRNPNGSAANVVRSGGGTVHVVPVIDTKDGYLATHSLFSSVVALLVSSDITSMDPLGERKLLDDLASHLSGIREPSARASWIATVGDLRRSDTIVVVNDPLVQPLAVLLDTSIWEASLCHVQTTDFRNLAHGRHGWLHHREDETLVLALTGVGSRAIWKAFDDVLPVTLNRFSLDNGSCGRLANAFALVDGLALLEAIGSVVGIDPGKPGIGEFGRLVYDDRSLEMLADTMPANVRQKRSAIAKSDAYDPKDDPLRLIARERVEALSQTKVGGAVFDYDGTIVTTAERWSVPDQAIVDELIRLSRAGLRIGIATGRGGSAGEDLRKVLPADVLSSILIGYYNGGHLRTADVDIVNDPPQSNQAITETAAWLRKQNDLFLVHEFKHREIQITIDQDKLRRPYRFPIDLQNCPSFSENQISLMGSEHSYDIVPASSCKLNVVEALRTPLPAGLEILCFGDSGSKFGNDYAILSHQLGISVGEVCGAANGTWSLFGVNLTGPDALLRILGALTTSDVEMIRFEVSLLGLDSR